MSGLLIWIGLCLTALTVGKSSGLTVWTELPNQVAQGSFDDVECYYKRLTKTVLDGAGTLRFNRLVVRVEDPWYTDWGPTVMNGWIFNPDKSHWDGAGRPRNPFYDMLVDLKRGRGSELKIFILPQLHQGSYFRWPCYPSGDIPNRTSTCADVPGYLASEDLGSLQCGGTAPAPPTTCSGLLSLPNGCNCTKSWQCASDWCTSPSPGVPTKCAAPPILQTEQRCAIPSAVSGDPSPWGHCCPKLQLTSNLTLDFSQLACCDRAETGTGICNAAEVKAKGGTFPCLNPLNRVVFWMHKWQELLLNATGHGFGGIVLDMESTGLSDTTLITGLRHYMTYYMGEDVARSLQIGCTVGNTLPEPNSLYEHFDFWLLEAYNLYTATLSSVGTCTEFLVDSLPYDQQGQCSRECKGATCNLVNPPCDTSMYEIHKNDPRALVGAKSDTSLTFNRLLNPSTIDCTTSWHAVPKQYEYAYSMAKKSGSSTSNAKEAARRQLQVVFNKTVMLFSTETRLDHGQPISCLYPDNSDCGVPRAFGTWEVDQFQSFIDQHFREIEFKVVMDDGTEDIVQLDWLPQDYAGVFQFNFLPKAWLSEQQLKC